MRAVAVCAAAPTPDSRPRLLTPDPWLLNPVVHVHADPHDQPVPPAGDRLGEDAADLAARRDRRRWAISLALGRRARATAAPRRPPGQRPGRPAASDRAAAAPAGLPAPARTSAPLRPPTSDWSRARARPFAARRAPSSGSGRRACRGQVQRPVARRAQRLVIVDPGDEVDGVEAGEVEHGEADPLPAGTPRRAFPTALIQSAAASRPSRRGCRA